MLVDARITRKIYESGDFRIFACEIVGDNPGITLNTYENFCITGDLCYLQEGQTYQLDVEEITHAKYGLQYKVRSVPSIDTFLSDIKNIPPDLNFAMLKQVTTEDQATYVQTAYPNFCELILNGRQSEINTQKIYNVGSYRLNLYATRLKEQFKYYFVKQKYECYNLTFKEAKTLSNMFIDLHKLDDKFEKNPYKVLMLNLERSFEKTDACVLKVRPELKDSSIRTEALMWEILLKNESDGNTKMNANILAYYIKKKDAELIKHLKPIAVKSEDIYYNDDTKEIALQSTYDAEERIAKYLYLKQQHSVKWDIDWKQYKTVDGFELTDTQLEALHNLCDNDISLLVGFSGSGKTSTTKSVIKMLDDNNKSYVLLCPTGKAAKRLNECTDRHASTIHKAVMTEKVFGDVIIVDECSMISTDVMTMLITALKQNPHCKVMFIGDNAQLSPIGLGNTFHDMINSETIPKIMLTEIFRYKDNGSLYVATNIRQGLEYLDGYTTQQFGENFLSIESENMLQDITDAYVNLIKDGVSYRDIMCLSPYNVGQIGTYSINNEIQNIVNEITDDDIIVSYRVNDTLVRFKVGDMVINTKNNYDMPLYECDNTDNPFGDENESELQFLETTVYNGETGVVREIKGNKAIIQFDEDLVVFDPSNIQNLLLGYCISVHRSQGSESPYVISVVSPKHARMLNRNMLYVANTRSSGKHIEIRDLNTVNEAIKHAGHFERETFLNALLQRTDWVDDRVNVDDVVNYMIKD